MTETEKIKKSYYKILILNNKIRNVRYVRRYKIRIERLTIIVNKIVTNKI